MYRCDVCGKTSWPREKLTRIVAEVRQRQYPEDAGGGVGSEIVREVVACPRCVKRVTAES